MKKWTRREWIPLMGLGLAGGAALALNQQEHSQDHQKKNTNEYLLHLPKRLKKGDTIGICAPSGPLRRNEEAAEFTTILHQMGFKVMVGLHSFEKNGYFAGTDEQRATDFNDFIKEDSVDGIFFLRGGWGCARILPYVDFENIQNNPKVIMGFSDATSLLNAITEKTGVITFHGPSGNSSWNDYSKNYIRRVLMEVDPVHYKNQEGDHAILTLTGGMAKGILLGGNLSVLTSMIGTPYFPTVDGGLLFLEEVGEEPYRIDRMLTQLQQAGIFDRCAGIILGNFRKCTAEEPERSFTLEQVFGQHFNDFGKPVYYGAQIGHTVNKWTVPIGVPAIMDADKGEVQLVGRAVN